MCFGSKDDDVEGRMKESGVKSEDMVSQLIAMDLWW